VTNKTDPRGFTSGRWLFDLPFCGGWVCIFLELVFMRYCRVIAYLVI
jgi:hypothetical protein